MTKETLPVVDLAYIKQTVIINIQNVSFDATQTVSQKKIKI